MLSPRPTPPVRRVLLSPSWWKASKIDARSSAAMPVPVSVTSIVTRPGSAPGRADIETIPSSVNLTPLSTRLRTISCSLIRSVSNFGTRGSTLATKRTRPLSIRPA